MNEYHKDAPEYVYLKKTEGYEHNWYGEVASFADEDAAEYIRSDLVDVNYDALAYENLKEEHKRLISEFKMQYRELADLRAVLSNVKTQVSKVLVK